MPCGETRETARVGIPGRHADGPCGARVRDLYLTVYEGEYVAVMGADGSGKDALGLALCGGSAYRSGEVWVSGAPFAPESIRQAHRRKVFLIPKEGISSPPNPSPKTSS